MPLYFPGRNQKGLYDPPVVTGKLALIVSSSVTGGAPPAPTLVSIAVSPSPGTFRPTASTDTLQLSATGTYSDASTADITSLVTWTSNTTPVATVGAATGLVSPVLVGNASITASLDGVDGATLITVDTDRDGPSTAYRVPVNAYQWTLAGLPAPISIWSCQESTGSLADGVGGLTLAVGGSPTYQEPLPSGWTRTAVRLFDGSSNSFLRLSGTLPNAVQASIAWMAYAHVTSSAPAAGRNLVLVAGAGIGLQQLSGGSRIRAVFGGGGTNGAVGITYADGAVHPFMISDDHANSRSRVHTDLEAISGTFGAHTDGAKGLGNGASVLSTGYRVGYLVAWTGSDAEQIGKSTLQVLGWPTPY